jgi:hypothetical protein
MVGDVDDHQAGAYLSLFYEPGPWGGGRSHCGPTYCWRGKRLVERYWSEAKGRGHETRDYTYYPTGQLFRYSHRETDYDPRKATRGPFELLEEFFARDGTMLGCGYAARVGSAPSSFVGYWLGTEVSGGAFLDRQVEAKAAAMR